MRVAWTVVLSAILASGCLTTVVPEHQGQQSMGGVGGGGNGGGGGGGNNGGGGGGEDLGNSQGGNDHDLAGVGSNVDLAGVAPGSLLFGQVCSTGADCKSGFCEPANMGANLECTQQCTMLGANDPTCPNQANGSPGFCNQKGFCKP